MGGYEPRLGRAFTFGAADLEANRCGVLSADQRVLFANAVQLGARRERRMVPLLLVLAAVTVGLAVWGSGAIDDPGSALPALAVVVVMLAFLAVLVAAFRRRDQRSRAVMSTASIEVAEGPWELDTSLDGTWRIRVDGRLVAADRLAVEALAESGHYRFYLLPLPRVAAVLSVERIG
jgi:hypothetical protein